MPRTRPCASTTRSCDDADAPLATAVILDSEAIPMVMIYTRYAGRLRVEARHAPSGIELHTDAPVDNQGRGASFSPTDLVATALGACIATIMGIAAERHDIDIEGMTIDVRKSMVHEPARRIGKLDVRVRVPGELEDRQKKLLEQAAKGCPVHHSLHPDIEILIHYEWNATPVSSLDAPRPEARQTTEDPTHGG